MVFVHMTPPAPALRNKFRDVVVAHKRALQLMGGARPRVHAGIHKVLWVAMREVDAGLVSWDSSDLAPATEGAA
jgi:DNA-directed RNA polymerase omega subunit